MSLWYRYTLHFIDPREEILFSPRKPGGEGCPTVVAPRDLGVKGLTEWPTDLPRPRLNWRSSNHRHRGLASVTHVRNVMKAKGHLGDPVLPAPFQAPVMLKCWQALAGMTETSGESSSARSSTYVISSIHNPEFLAVVVTLASVS